VVVKGTLLKILESKEIKTDIEIKRE
jgi:hypothetical protein